MRRLIATGRASAFGPIATIGFAFRTLFSGSFCVSFGTSFSAFFRTSIFVALFLAFLSGSPAVNQVADIRDQPLDYYSTILSRGGGL